MIKLGYTIMIAAVSDVESGVKKFGRKGDQKGAEIIQILTDTWLKNTSRHFKVQLHIVLLIKCIGT